MTLVMAAAPPRRPAVPKPVHRCDLCSIPSNAGIRIIRFALVQTKRTPNGRRTTRGVGTLLLCYRCWRTTAGQRRFMRGKVPPVEP